MILEDKILINQYGQGIVDEKYMMSRFEGFKIEGKKIFLEDMIYLLIQSNIGDSDLELAIKDSGLKATFTPCVILKKGINQNNLYRTINLPENEQSKTFILFLSLFKIGYQRRFKDELNSPSKWWYWDLSNKDNVERIRNMYS